LPEAYKNDVALLSHLVNPAVCVYLEAELGINFSVGIYGTEGD
tara:strand:- start:233 stop:361 length:129 start_codon:yes stop_codon:yes gene_type:complete